tara:strand:+ start:50 stop:529 length:480 start_codon:yes stop_codon:yes gene_type:complete
MNFRVGFGFDVHELREGLDFYLGGIKIDHKKGSYAHSDGDVLIHAICDALLGAANLGDIGKHFPDTDPKYKGIDSKMLLRKVISLIDQQGFDIVNIDSTVCLQKPKIRLLIDRMQEVLSDCMKINTDLISIKATTNEKLGFIGREEGVAAYATVLINKK